MNKTSGKVLIVDDEVAVRKALETVLRGLNFDVRAISCGEEAVSSVRTFRYEVVLLDIAMPGMDGLATCRELRRVAAPLGDRDGDRS